MDQNEQPQENQQLSELELAKPKPGLKKTYIFLIVFIVIVGVIFGGVISRNNNPVVLPTTQQRTTNTLTTTPQPTIDQKQYNIKLINAPQEPVVLDDFYNKDEANKGVLTILPNRVVDRRPHTSAKYSPSARKIIYFERDNNADERLFLFDIDSSTSKQLAIPETIQNISDEAISNDGDKIIIDESEKLWLYDIASNNVEKISESKSEGGEVFRLTLSPDSKKVLVDQGFTESSDYLVADIKTHTVKKTPYSTPDNDTSMPSNTSNSYNVLGWLDDNNLLIHKEVFKYTNDNREPGTGGEIIDNKLLLFNVITQTENTFMDLGPANNDNWSQIRGSILYRLLPEKTSNQYVIETINLKTKQKIDLGVITVESWGNIYLGSNNIYLSLKCTQEESCTYKIKEFNLSNMKNVKDVAIITVN